VNRAVLSHIRAAGIAAFVLAHGVASQETKPPVPSGRDPGGVAVALLSTGIDYTRPEIANRLARDGEGELIGWDLIDNDRRPFPRDGDATEIAVALLTAGYGTRLVPVRVNPADPVSLARAVAFVSQTPARVAAVPLWSASRDNWEPFRQAASHFQRILFVLAAGDGGKDIDRERVFPALLDLPNALVVTAADAATLAVQPDANWGGTSVDAVVPAANSALATGVAAAAVVSMLDQDTSASGAEIKRKILERAPQRTAESPPKTRTLTVLRVNPPPPGQRPARRK
jgi:hypothetical protein